MRHARSTPLGDAAQLRWFDRMRTTYGESPTHRLLGLEFLDVAPGHVTIGLTSLPDTRNAFGGVHGGVLNTAIDSALLQAVRTNVSPGDRLTTIELKVNFMRPAIADRFTCTGTALRVGGSLGVAEAKLYDGDGSLVAAGMGTIHIKRERNS